MDERGPKPQRDWLTKVHDAGDPSVIDQIGHAEFGDLSHSLRAVGARIDVFVVDELGADAQVAAAANGVSEGFLASCGDFPLRTQCKCVCPLGHHESSLLTPRAYFRCVSNHCLALEM